MARSQPKRTGKRKLYKLHTWIGFHFMIIMTVVLFTGTIATISNEIDWLTQHDMRVVPDGEKVSWDEMEAFVRAAAPTHMLNVLEEQAGDHFAYRATMTKPDGKQYFMHVNQWTGEVTGTTPRLTVQRFFRDLHRYLFMPSIIGLPIVSAMAFVLALSLYTGLKTAGKLRKTAVRLRRDKGTRILVGDLHKAIGIWASWFFIVVVITGIWYLVEFGAAVGGVRFEPERPTLTAEQTERYDSVMRHLSADELVEIASAELPNWRATQIIYSSRLGNPATVLGVNGNPLIRKRANRVFIDPVSGDAIKVQKSSEINAVAYLNEMADPIHFGFFGKLPTKLIWFVFGVGMTGLSVTGVWLTYRRLGRTFVSRAQLATLPVMLLCMIAGKFYLDFYLVSEEPGQLVASVNSTEAGFTIESRWEAGERTGKPRIKVEVSHPEGRPLVDSVDVEISGLEAVSLRQRSFDRVTNLSRQVPELSNAERVIVRIRFVGGEVIEQTLLSNQLSSAS